MADRYAVPFQAFITNGAVITVAEAGRIAAAGNTTLNLSTTGGAGTFTITLASGASGTVTSGTATITGSVVTLSAGANVLTSNGAGTCTLALTLGTAANWNTVNTWSAATGGVSGASVPTSADNAVFDALSFTAASQVLTVDAAANTLDMTWTGAANIPTLAGTTATLNIYGSMTLITATTDMIWAYNYNVGFKSTTTGKTITTAGNGLYYTSFNGVGGGWTLQDSLATANLRFIVQAGTVDTNGQTVTSGAFELAGAGTKVLTLGASVINCTSWEYSGSNATISANTSTIKVTGTGAFAGGAIATYNNIELNGTAHTVSGSFTCATLTRNGTATKTDTITLTSGATVTCTTCAMIGNSATNRLLVQSSTLGTAATITATNWTGTLNSDIMDITATNAVDFQTLTIVTGDCGGNTGITFTTAAAQTWDGTTGSWSNAAKWTSRVPLPQDDVSAGGAGNTITVDMPRIGASITFTGTPTVSLSNSISNYGSYILASGMTWTHNNCGMIPCGRGEFTLTSNGVGLFAIYMFMVNGTLTLQDSLNCSWRLEHENGTLDFNDKDVTLGVFWDGNGVARTLNLGNGTITLNYASAIATKWSPSANLTLNAGNSTIVMTNSTANAQTFVGRGLTYNHVRVEGAGAYTLTITGNNTFNTLTIDRSEANKAIAGAVTCTVTVLSIPVSGTRTVTITDTDFVMALRRIATDYLALTGCVGSGGASFYAGNHSTDNGGNTGWKFRHPPVGIWK